MLQNIGVWFVIVGRTATALFAQQTASPPEKPSGSAYVQRMMSLDRDKNGFLSVSELPGKLAGIVEQHDLNGDRQLSRSELARIEDGAVSARDDRPGQSARQAARQRRGGGRTAGVGGSPLDAKQILRFALTFDKDNDGGLSAEELRVYATALAARRAQSRKMPRGIPKTGKPDSEKRAPAGLGSPNDSQEDPFGPPKSSIRK